MKLKRQIGRIFVEHSDFRRLCLVQEGQNCLTFTVVESGFGASGGNDIAFLPLLFL